MPSEKPELFASCCEAGRSAGRFLMRGNSLVLAVGHGVPIRWELIKQIANEEIDEFSFAVSTAGSMASAGNKQQIKVFAGFDQAVRHLKSRRRIDVLIHFADDQHQFALEAPGIVDVGRLGVPGTDG